jgi:nicotinamide-nucleotide amidase
MRPDPELFTLAQRVGERLRQQRRSLAVAESCTGGLLAAALTDVPGSSAYFLGGIVPYSDAVKVRQLGVPETLLAQEGAVSSGTAAAMATAVRNLLQADIGVAITGVAGPGAEGPKPAGLTFISVAAPEPTTHRYQWSGDRWENRRRSVAAALELLAQAIEGVMP